MLCYGILWSGHIEAKFPAKRLYIAADQKPRWSHVRNLSEISGGGGGLGGWVGILILGSEIR